MINTTYRGRRAVQIENDLIRVTATVEGAHIAEIVHKPTAVNPLWLPPWPTMEPTRYNRAQHPEYGSGCESQLLAGILGHNICLDTFGEPSPEEAAAGMTVHGEAPVIPYEVAPIENGMLLVATLEKAQLRFERQVRIANDPTRLGSRFGRTPNSADSSGVVVFTEVVENLSASDRPIAWTEHVTLGPPFLARGETQFRISATRSKTIGQGFNNNQGPHLPDAEFDWPLCPGKDGTREDLRVFTSEPVSGGFTAHLMDPAKEQAHFVALSPATEVLFGYAWKRVDFPWLGRWEENHLRTQPPWNGQGLACGMEFGVSPMAETRRQMVDRATLFGTPSFRWAPARTRLEVRYCAFIGTAPSIPNSVEWDGGTGVVFS
jgi:hypothetical protein